MDKNRISFIVRKQDDACYEELVQYLMQLQVPDGYHADIVAIETTAGKASAYNEGMQQSDAKYKIYLDEKTRILKCDFLQKMLEIFSQDDSIGILGVVGTLTIPTTGICRDGKKRIGRLIAGAENQNRMWGNVSDAYQFVAALDDCLLMTQRDIPWRADLFVEDFFYDTAQCIEFQRRGYKAAVMRQEDYWVQDRRDVSTGSQTGQTVFLDEYSQEIYPKVLIIITTFNRPEYLRVALEGAIKQTYRNLEIVVTDDSTNDLTEQMIQPYLETDRRIKYVRQKDYTVSDNWLWALRYIKDTESQYINFLMDDDVITEDKISHMMTYFWEYEGISLVTSYRKLIDGNGNLLPDYQFNERLFAKTTRIAGRGAGRKILFEQKNFIGETSTVLFSKKYMRAGNRFGWINDIDPMVGLPDVSMWLQLLSQGDMIYIAEPLNFFRLHAGQGQGQFDTIMACMISWGRKLTYAFQAGVFFDNETEYRQTLSLWLANLAEEIDRGIKQGQSSSRFDLIVEKITMMIDGMMKEYVERDKIPSDGVYTARLPMGK